MLRLRLQRRGKRNYATYRVVVADQRAPIKGKFIADVGFYNPHTNEFKVDAKKVKNWLGNGVQASPTVHNLLLKNKVITGKKVTSWRPKRRKDEESQNTAAGSKTSQSTSQDNKDNANEPEQLSDVKN